MCLVGVQHFYKRQTHVEDTEVHPRGLISKYLRNPPIAGLVRISGRTVRLSLVVGEGADNDKAAKSVRLPSWVLQLCKYCAWTSRTCMGGGWDLVGEVVRAELHKISWLPPSTIVEYMRADIIYFCAACVSTNRAPACWLPCCTTIRAKTL